ncbi:NADH-quinone oxidoreductase subunit C, partial [Streptomyces toyocaensis]|uniref:NADH-quinone oxidoreductase subunit C n=1 Tax=Streptomyces toyocaensis TaxID=55952 RepID=UPI0033D71F3F
MTAVGWLPAGAGELFGTEATAEESYGVLTVDVPSASWTDALRAARDRLGCTFFDWLSAVDEPGTGFRVTAHVAALAPVRRLLLRTTVPHEAPTLPSAVDVYAGAAWHERETHEMFGVDFTGHPALDHLLLPDTFEGHPLRKDFVLAARVAKAWPGAKEPGESEHGGPKRRQMLPPGVPDPNDWGPLKGQLPPAPARPARGAGRPAAAAARTPGDRPPRRTRTAAEGSASQAAGPEAQDVPATPARRTRTAAEGSASQAAATESSAQPSASPRRTRTAAEGSAGQAAGPGAPARRARSASEGSASQRPDTPAVGGSRRARTASEGSASQRAAGEAAAAGEEAAASEGRPDHRPPVAARSPDAPWHHARPAFTEPEPERPAQPSTEPGTGTGPEPRPGAEAQPGPPTEPEPRTGPEPEPEAGPPTESGPEPRPSTESGPDAESEPRTGPEPELEAGPSTESGPEPGPSTESGPDAESEPRTGPEPEPEAGPPTESGPEPGPSTESGPDAESEPRTGPEPEPEAR